MVSTSSASEGTGTSEGDLCTGVNDFCKGNFSSVMLSLILTGEVRVYSALITGISPSLGVSTSNTSKFVSISISTKSS